MYTNNRNLNGEQNSPIASHSVIVHNRAPAENTWEFTPLIKETNTFKRKILEAIYIRNYKPQLNRDNGVNYILCNFTRALLKNNRNKEQQPHTSGVHSMLQ